MPEVKFLVRGDTVGDVISDYVRQITKATIALSEGNSYTDPRAEGPYDKSSDTEYTFSKLVHSKDPGEDVQWALSEATFAITRILEQEIDEGTLITGDVWRERETAKRKAAND